MPPFFERFDGWVLIREVAPVVLLLLPVSALIAYPFLRVADYLLDLARKARR